MTQFVFLVVLSAALLDAVMHSLIKGSRDSFSMSLFVGIFGGLVALPVLAATGLPEPAAYPWLVASVAVGIAYWVLLGWAYQSNSLALVFPVSRGAAVLMTTLGASVLMHETLSTRELLTVGIVIVGLAIVAAHSARGRFTWAGVFPSLIIAVVISAFTLIDAAGVRVSGSAAAYCAVIYIGNAIGVSVYAAMFQRARLSQVAPLIAMPALGIAALSMTVYTMLLYGFTHAPVAVVAALAETSIVFAAIFGVVWLQEPARLGHIAGIAMIASGAAFLQLVQ
jgi:drug/metabolite transporter (DMT)-like permease